jgi:hypothetical protein
MLEQIRGVEQTERSDSRLPRLRQDYAQLVIEMVRLGNNQSMPFFRRAITFAAECQYSNDDIQAKRGIERAENVDDLKAVQHLIKIYQGLPDPAGKKPWNRTWNKYVSETQQQFDESIRTAVTVADRPSPLRRDYTELVVEMVKLSNDQSQSYIQEAIKFATQFQFENDERQVKRGIEKAQHHDLKAVQRLIEIYRYWYLDERYADAAGKSTWPKAVIKYVSETEQQAEDSRSKTEPEVIQSYSRRQASSRASPSRSSAARNQGSRSPLRLRYADEIAAVVGRSANSLLNSSPNKRKRSSAVRKPGQDQEVEATSTEFSRLTERFELQKAGKIKRDEAFYRIHPEYHPNAEQARMHSYRTPLSSSGEFYVALGRSGY